MGLLRGRSIRRIFLLLLLAGGLGAGAKCANPAQAAGIPLLDRASFAVRTMYGTGTNPCTGEKVTTGGVAQPILNLLGIRVPNIANVPTAIDVNGNGTNDLAISLIVIPGSVATGPDVVQLTATKLPGAPARMLAEVILAPEGAGKPRVAFGYNGCEGGAPAIFTATVLRTVSGATTTLDIDAPNIVAPPANLKLIGGAFDDPGANSTLRPNPVDLTVRMQPVPSSIHAVVKMTGNDDYTAVLTPNAATKLGVELFRKKGAQTMSLTGTLDRLAAGDLTLVYNPKKIAFTAPAGFNAIDLNLEAYTPVTDITDKYAVNLTGVPKAATINRNGSAMDFIIPSGNITTTKVKYSSLAAGVAPATVTAPVIDRAGHTADQYLAANVEPAGFTAQVRVLGLSGATIDTGDPIKVGLTHPAAPFYVDASQRRLEATEGCATCPLRFVTRHLQTNILNMPSQANITYSPARGDFTYTGNGIINEITTRLESTRPLVDDATIAKLTLRGVPTGLTGRIDSKAKTFTAAVTNGSIGLVEAQVTSGPDIQLPPGVDGIRLDDHDGSYVAFVRVQALKSASVGWGSTQFATVTHDAKTFLIRIDADDPDLGTNAGFTVRGYVSPLPSVAHVEYTPTATKSTFKYSGSSLIDEVRFTLQTAKPFDADKGTDTAKILARAVPSVTIETDEVAHTIKAFVPEGVTFPGPIGGGEIGVAKLVIDNTPKKVGLLFIEVCAADSCALSEPNFQQTSTPSQPDRVWVIDRTNQYDVQALARGLSSFTATVVKDDHDVLQSAAIKLDHDAGPFDVLTLADKSKTVVIPGPRNDLGTPTLVTRTYNWSEAVEVIARDLPKTVELEYNPLLGRVTYAGSNKVTSLDVKFSKNGDGQMVAGRAPRLHALINDLSPGATVMYAVDDTLGFTIDTGGVPIGHIAFELLSDPTILTRDAIASSPITQGTQDGLLMWDLHNTVNGTPQPSGNAFVTPRVFADGVDGVHDPYAVIVRVTGLKHFELSKVVDNYDTRDPLDLRDTLRATATRSSRKDIGVDIRNDNLEKVPYGVNLPSYETLAGWGFFDQYNYDHLFVTYKNPATTLGFKFADRSGGGPKQTWIDVWGNERGGRIDADTNMGALNKLGATVQPIPVGTEADAGVHACFAGNNMSCVPESDTTVNHAQTSVVVDVNEPIFMHVDVHVGSKGYYLDANLERLLRVSLEVDEDGIDSTHVFIDSDYSAIEAQFQLVDQGDLDTYIYAPPNTRAKNRWVDVQANDVNKGFNKGQLMCPAGFIAETWVWPQYLSVSDDVCTTSVLTGKTQEVIHPGSTDKTVDVYGWSFVDETVNTTTRERIIGTSVSFSDPRITVKSWDWVEPGHIRVTVDVPSAVPVGSYAITVGNPDTDDTTQLTQDAPPPCSCKLQVT